MSKLELGALLAYTEGNARFNGTAIGQMAIFPGGRSAPRRSVFHRFSKQTPYGCLANVVRSCLRGRRGLAGYYAVPLRISPGDEARRGARAHDGRFAGADARGNCDANSAGDRQMAERARTCR